MSDEAALLASIWESPLDDAPRLVYADWLEETGEVANVARAELIRVQCELDRIDEDDPRRADLRERDKALRAEFGRVWREGLPRGGVRGAPFRRGFPEPHLDVGPGGFLRQVEKAYWIAPSWTVNFRPADHCQNRQLGESPLLGRLSGLNINRRPASFAEIHDILGSPHLRHLRKLEFWRVIVSDADVFDLAAAPLAANLREIALVGAEIAAKGAGVLAGWPCRRGLHRLDLSGNALGTEGAAVLGGARWDRLRDLRLARNGIRDSGVEALARSGGLAGVARLDLGGNSIGAAGASALASGPGLPRLKELDLSGNSIGNTGAAALALSQHLAGLRKLNLAGNAIGDRGLRSLAESPYLAELQALMVYRNDYGSAGLEAIADSPHLAGLRQVWVDLPPAHNRESLMGRLRERFPGQVVFAEGNHFFH